MENDNEKIHFALLIILVHYLLILRDFPTPTPSFVDVNSLLWHLGVWLAMLNLGLTANQNFSLEDGILGMKDLVSECR